MDENKRKDNFLKSFSSFILGKWKFFFILNVNISSSESFTQQIFIISQTFASLQLQQFTADEIFISKSHSVRPKTCCRRRKFHFNLKALEIFFFIFPSNFQWNFIHFFHGIIQKISHWITIKLHRANKILHELKQIIFIDYFEIWLLGYETILSLRHFNDVFPVAWFLSQGFSSFHNFESLLFQWESRRQVYHWVPLSIAQMVKS